MMMKSSLLLLLVCLPLIIARLGGEMIGRLNESGEKMPGNSSNETFYAKSTIVPVFQSEIKKIDVNDVVTNDENVPFELSTAPADEVVFLNNAIVQNERGLQYVATVTITNHCMEQAFWLAIRYREERTGSYVNKGWYNVPSLHQVSFYDVVNGEYSMFALSHDYRFKWGGDPSTASFCVNGYCYQDFQTSGSNSFQYLSCYSGGPSPTPAPVPSPTNYPVALSYREKQWVDAHNARRATIHTQYGKSFKPLQWSAKLADSAQEYADLLATVNFETCYIAHGYQGNSYGGENLACDWGSSDYYFESPDAVLKRWFEDEENEPWPANGHRTQVAWRGTGFVGCGEARKQYDGNKYCKIHVCRYLAPGNCNIGGGTSLNDLMMDDNSPCGPQS